MHSLGEGFKYNLHQNPKDIFQKTKKNKKKNHQICIDPAQLKQSFPDVKISNDDMTALPSAWISECENIKQNPQLALTHMCGEEK